MRIWAEFFMVQANQSLAIFAHGLIFFLMGFAVLLQVRQTRHGSTLTLARNLSWLGWFGLVHAVASWGLVFNPLHTGMFHLLTIDVLRTLQTLLLTLSYALLLRFGVGLTTDTSGRGQGLKALPWLLYSGWLVMFLGVRSLPGMTGVAANTYGQIWASYTLALTASAWSAWALYKQIREFTNLKLAHLTQYIEWLIFALGLFAIAAALFVPSASFFPASFFNTNTFLAATGVPIEVVKALAGLLMMICTVRLLEVFDIDTSRRLAQAKQVRTILDERDRIARELHDGIMQQLYAIGLSLESLDLGLEREAPQTRGLIHTTIGQLNQTIENIRQYVMNLKGAEPHIHFSELLQDVVTELDHTLDVPVVFETKPHHAEDLPLETRNHIVQVVREALSGACSHKRVTPIVVTLGSYPGGIQIDMTDRCGPLLAHKTRLTGSHKLHALYERVALIDGQLTESRSGDQTTLTLRVPTPLPSGKQSHHM